MSVVSFDNTRAAAYTVPPLTSVDCQGRAMGEQAAMLTIERLADRSRPITHLTMPSTLIVRQSTCLIPADQPLVKGDG
jgi:LacI family transcriptional regulator